MIRPASPSPSLSECIYSIQHDTTSSPPPLPLSPPLHQSKQHKQAWYQAQQKTIQLDNPYNRQKHHPHSDTAQLFPLNVAVPEHTDRGRGSPTASRSPRPIVETFLSEQEMLDAGIHIIRRRHDDPSATPPSSKDSPRLATPRLHDQSTMPLLPPRLYGSEHPDFLEFIDSPVDSNQPSPLLDQLLDPPASSAQFQRALSRSHNKSSSGSLSVSSGGSTDYLPHEAASLNNGSTGSLSSGSKHSFSFTKLRRAATKPTNSTNPSHSSTANSSNEDVSGTRTFLFPPRNQSANHQNQSQQHPGSTANLAAPGSLTPGPGSSASPFLNKHSATVGRASRSIALGNGDTAKKGLAQVFNSRSISAATARPSSSTGSIYQLSATNGNPPAKPPRPRPSLLAAFPRSGGGSASSLGSISAPNTASVQAMHDSNRGNAGSAQDMLLHPPASAGADIGIGIYSDIAHSQSQEAVAEARLDAEALRASAATPLPPPRRLNPPRVGGGGGPAYQAYSQYTSPAMARSASAGGPSGVVGALGHVGQFGAAMGKKGWDFMKTLQTSNHTAGAGATSGRAGGATIAYNPGYQIGRNATANAASSAAENEATRQWLSLLDRTDLNMAPTSSDSVFGAPLKDAVLRSRLSSLACEANNNDDEHLDVPDLGQEFSANFLDSPGVTPRASVAVTAAKVPLSREQARHLYLPRVVVRCIESLEKWGPSEEGIYRISGRSSHTSKLRAHFSDPRNDLCLDEINPADIDINSVCSLLKIYLRELPEPLIPLTQSQLLDQAVARLLCECRDATDANADADAGASASASASAGKVTEARVAQLASDSVAAELCPLMRQLGVYNWYLLRELIHHLGMLAQPEVVASTKMPISNLTLVLAPTLSISLAVLQVMVRHEEVIFSGPVPNEDGAAGALVESVAALERERFKAQPPPRPAKPAKLSSPSRLPIMVRKRASSMGLTALLSSPSRKGAAESSARSHRRTPSATPSIELPAYLAQAAAAVDPAVASVASPTRAVKADGYERPSTSLGHFAELGDSRTPSSANPALSRDRFRGSRDAALRFDALALDDDQSRHQRTRACARDSTPIARYYARMRQQAQHELESERAKTPMATPIATPIATPMAPSASLPILSHTSAKRSVDCSLSPKLDASDARIASSGRTSALDRPRPPTSGSASFFAAKSRRQDSTSVRKHALPSAIPLAHQMREQHTPTPTPTPMLNSVNKSP